MHRFILFLTATILAAPVSAQNLTGGNLTLSGSIEQNGTGNNFFNGNRATFNGRACIGVNCDGSEPVNAEPLRLKSSAPNLLFEDTSTSSFASTDWELEINDGTFNGFSINDLDAATRPLTIEGSAPDASLWISDTGDIGLGTSLPSRKIEIVDSGRADIRLHRNTSGGLTRSDWEMATDTDGYFIRDVVTSQTPFVIENMAPDTALRVKAITGNIGLGTTIPGAPLHISRTDGTANLIVENTSASPSAVREMFKMANNGGSYFTLENSVANTEWFFVHEDASPNRFIITDGVADGPEMTLTADGTLTIEGELVTAGSCSAGCDRVFDADYPLPTITEQAEMMRTLKHLPNVGPTAEDGPFNITEMTGGMLNELEKAHLYIVQLEERLAAVEALLMK